MEFFSFTFFKKEKPDNLVISILLFISLIVFIRIDSSEIQPWDEGLYAIRARSILLFNAVFDQTEFTVGGLYSSTYPPLFVWAMALSIRIFGETTFAVRFIPALSSVISIVIIFIISRKIMKKEYALISAILLAGTNCWNTYSRQGMTDIPLITSILLSLLLLIKINDMENIKKIILYSIFLIIMIIACLLIKITISFLPIIFILYLVLINKNQKIKYLFLSIGFISISISSIWYIFMSTKYGNVFINSLLLPHLYSVVENNVSNLGIFYYLNQLIISNPLIIIAFIFSLYKFKKVLLNNNYILIIILGWFYIGLFFFSISSTKLPHYTNFIVPPAIILTGYFLQKIEYNYNKKYVFIEFMLIIFSIWAFWGNLRIHLKNIIDISIILQILIIFVFLFLMFLLIKIKFKNISITIKNKLFIVFEKLNNYKSFKILSIVIIFILLLRVIANNTINPNGSFEGAKQTSKYLISSDEKNFIYLYHLHNNADSLNPQLDWYLNGWMCNWQKNKTYKPFSLNESKVNYKLIDSLECYNNLLIVYFKPKNKYVGELTKERLIKSRDIIINTESYIVFSKIKRILYPYTKEI